MMTTEIQEAVAAAIAPLIKKIEILEIKLSKDLSCLSTKDAAPLLTFPSAAALVKAIDRGQFKLGTEVCRRGDNGPYIVNVKAIRERWARESTTGGFR